MTYQLPDNLADLRTWLAAQGADEFKTERQATFMAQQLAGTRFKFPPKGKSCLKVLEAIQRSVTVQNGQSASRKNDLTEEIRSEKPTVRSNRKVAAITQKTKRGKASRPRPSRPAITSATDVDTGLVIYCDGACEPNPGAGGWGYVVYRDGVEIHSDCGGSVSTTNNIMEMTGALMALRWFSERGVVEPVRILCDSRYTVDGCNDWRLSWKARGWKRKGKNPEIANLDLWKELDEALTADPIRLEWVKGHAGIIGNERADELSLIGREAALEAEADDCGDLIAEQLRYEVV